MALKRDRVNRVAGLVYLPVDTSRYVVGDSVWFQDVVENPIDCGIRDAMQMQEPIDGNAVGDAVFDALIDGSVNNVCDAMLPYGTGCIVLNKVMYGTGFDPDMQFRVLVSLNGMSPQAYSMKAGQSLTLDGLEDSTPYVVSEEVTPEQTENGYSLLSIENASGTISSISPMDVVIHNKYERPQFYGGLDLAVTISGEGYDTSKVFKVTVKFSEPVNYSIDGGEPSAVASDIYVARLIPGQHLILGHILVGASYNVAAVPLAPADTENGYSYDSIVGGSGIIYRDVTNTATVNYLYHGSTGSLVVSVAGTNLEADKAFHVVITFSRVIGYSVNGASAIAESSSVYVAELKDNESVTLSNIPNGVAYAVTPSLTDGELDEGYTPDTTGGAYPRRGTMDSSTSPLSEIVRFARN